MNTRLFLDAIGEIDDKYITEAMGYERKRRPHGWVKWGAVAACFVAVAAVALTVLPGVLNRAAVALPGGQSAAPASIPVATVQPAAPQPPAEAHAETHINMNDITVNELGPQVDAARIYYDPELYDIVEWNREEVLAYYGKDLTPPYIPDGLIASPHSGTATAVLDKSGAVVEDTVWVSYYHGFYEDGSPLLTDDVAANKGFSISMSKLGLVTDCIYILPENEVITSNFGGTAVTFGCRSMSYGPYALETHEPSGYYDMYVAEFEIEGIEYQIVADQMELKELVKVVASIIFESGDVVID